MSVIHLEFLEHLERLDVRPRSAIVLGRLYFCGVQDLSALQGACNTSKSMLSRIVKDLLNHGFAKKIRQNTDGHTLGITESGIEKAVEIFTVPQK